jgi:colanic acid/amylovoran biosynthesis glycosyltransferase
MSTEEIPTIEKSIRAERLKEGVEMKHIAFVLLTFPTLTETFVAGEIKALKERFPESEIYSLRPPFDEIMHEESTALMKRTHYLPSAISWEVMSSNLKWFLKSPFRYLYTMGYLLMHTISNPLHMLKSFYLFPQAAHLAWLLKENGTDHIHSHWATYPTTVALIASALTGIPFSFTSHACDMSMIKTLMAEKVKRAKFVITCVAENVRYLSKFLTEEQLSKVKVNYHGSNLKKFRPDLRKNGSNGRPTVMSCADFHERKGLPYLIQAVALAKRKNYDFKCVIVGDGPQRPLIERMVDDLGLRDRVEMPGSMTQEKLINYYAASDLFVLPCMMQKLTFFKKNADVDRYKVIECKMGRGEGVQKDGIPNVLVEVMAMKIPVISTRVAGIPELIENGENGLLVQEKNSEELCDAMLTLLSNKELRLKLGENGYRKVRERFDRSKNIEELISIFQFEVNQ